MKTRIRRNALIRRSIPAALLAILLATGATDAASAQTQAKPSASQPSASAKSAAAPQEPNPPDDNAPLPGDWGPELLYGIWNSPNPDASDELYRAAFAAGPDVIPQLEAALKDDRTAEFAAQSLAYIGGNRAIEILGRLTKDPRDLGLKRFFYGALGEIDSPEATRILFDAIANADQEPDRTITETAILAFTVRSDAATAEQLREVETKVQDPVIRDDLVNAADVISSRARYLATPAGANPDYSLERAVRLYFIPGLGALPEPPAKTAAKTPANGKSKSAASRAQSELEAKVRVDQVTLSPDKMRALASVSFTIPSAIAHYTMVLAKRGGNWQLASVWLGSEEEIPIAQ
jgi:HEAT repeats